MLQRAGLCRPAVARHVTLPPEQSARLHRFSLVTSEI